jgi:hypothetical protein
MAPTSHVIRLSLAGSTNGMPSASAGCRKLIGFTAKPTGDEILRCSRTTCPPARYSYWSLQ